MRRIEPTDYYAGGPLMAIDTSDLTPDPDDTEDDAPATDAVPDDDLESTDETEDAPA